ncbi:MAG TPA: SUF system NifU family Fe-S cluster assembly protein [Saprospiraceae bacterium]|nr:SUF system NifU family Fe-S cluster assembly protein [Saprospiraceae bacterium]
MNEKLKQLYQTVILQKSKAPFQYEKRPDATHQIEANNPVCGDRFTLYLDMADGIIQDAAFYGHGCAISKSSASILTENIIGLSKEEALSYSQKMKAIVDPKQALPDESEDLLAFAAARDFPERETCATLAWEKLSAFLTQRLSNN